MVRYKKISLADENDKPVTCGNWDLAYSGKYYIRAVQVWLFDEKNRIFVQKRARLKVYPFYYDVSVSGHVDCGESYEKAAARELKEELGINAKVKGIMKKKFEFSRAKLFMTLFFAKYKTREGKIKFNNYNNETLSGQFLTVDEIERMIKARKHFMKSFKIFFEAYFGG